MAFRFGVEKTGSGKRYGKTGIITNATGVTTDLQQNIDYLRSKEWDIQRVFSPEHGLYATFANGEDVPDENYRGIPVRSLYSEKSQAVNVSDIDDLDTVIFDIQDAGVRHYTYLSTLYRVMEALKGLHSRILVLDRPNPVGGSISDGPVLKDGFQSFVGIDMIPTRYGMTIGEAAVFFDRNIGVDPEVVKMEGYARDTYYDDLTDFYVPFSWNLPNMDSVFNYIGMCIFESIDVSVGRGTPYPFSQIGFPAMWKLDLRGSESVRLRPTEFSSLLDPRLGERLQGYFVHVLNRRNYEPLRLWLNIYMRIARELGGEVSDEKLRRLYGSDELSKGIKNGESAEEIASSWDDDLKKYQETRKNYLLY